VAAAALFLQHLVWAPRAERWGDPAVLAALSAGVAAVIHPLFAKVRSRAERSPAFQATDPLTGLPARRGWEGRVPQLLHEAAEARQPVCVVAIHIDRLKAYAERYGRKDADRLVREAAALWRDRLRKSDLFVRLDSSNFAALLVGCSVEAAAGIAQRLTTILESPVTFSLGVAEWNGQESAAALSRRADAALDRARRGGGDRIEFGTLPSTDLEFLDWQGTVTLTEPSASDTSL
jgi:diguanylate cyclase (GGDEF)-like protein